MSLARMLISAVVLGTLGMLNGSRAFIWVLGGQNTQVSDHECWTDLTENRVPLMVWVWDGSFPSTKLPPTTVWLKEKNTIQA